MRVLILAATAVLLSGCVAAKIVTIPVKAATGVVGTAADIVD